MRTSKHCANSIHSAAIPTALYSVSADLGVDDLLIHFLMGHAPDGISQKYIATLILANGPKMREEQSRMSKRMVELLGLTTKTFREEIAAALAASLGTGQARALGNARTLARAQRASARARRGKPLGPRMKTASAA